MTQFVEESFTTASQFLDALRLSNPRWKPGGLNWSTRDTSWERAWIFRGQSSHEFPLLPKAWRADTYSKRTAWYKALKHTEQIVVNQKIIGSVIPSEKENWLRQRVKGFDDPQFKDRLEEILRHAFTEMTLINEFRFQANDVGFVITDLPKSTLDYKKFAMDYVVHLFDTPIQDMDQHGYPILSPDVRYEWWSNQMVALAQHHGIATRLLDWTRNPLTAAFFAAASTASSTTGTDKLVVYALNRELLIKSKIQVVEVPSGNNDFLRAQAGLFTLDLNGDMFMFEHGRFPGIEDSIQPLSAKEHERPIKLLLPIEQAQELMRLLHLERVSHAHLMPTLDHVAEAVNVKFSLSAQQMDG